MPSNFPTSIDTFAAKKVIDLEDALEAVEAKLGVDGSGVATTVDNKLATLTTDLAGKASTAHLHTGTYVEPPPSTVGVQYVSTSGNDASNGRSWAAAKLTVQAAINALPNAGGTVELGAGTFAVTAGVVKTVAGRTVRLTGQEVNATIIDATGMVSGTVIDFLNSTFRGDLIENLQIIGPGSGSSVTGIKPYHGTMFRNVWIRNLGVGVDLTTLNGAAFAGAGEISGCGIAIDVTTNGNFQVIGDGLRLLGNAKGVRAKAQGITIRGVWFESNTDTEVTALGVANGITVEDCWFENSHTNSPIFLDSLFVYMDVTSVNVSHNVFSTGADHIVSIDTAEHVRVTENYLDGTSMAAVKINRSVTVCDLSRNNVLGIDGQTDRGYLAKLSVIGDGKLVQIIEGDDLGSIPLDRTGRSSGGFAFQAGANLVADGSFETALSAVGSGGTPPTVTWDSDAHYGVKSCKVAFTAAMVGTSSYTRTQKILAATAGQWYLWEFSAKASTPMRAITCRLFHASNGFEAQPLAFVELGTSYRRYRFIWKAPTTGNWELTFFKQVATSGAIDLWVDDIAAWAGTAPVPYLPGHTTAIPANSDVAYDLLVGRKLMTPATTAATTPGAVVRKLEVFDASGVSLGFIPIYSTIT